MEGEQDDIVEYGEDVFDNKGNLLCPAPRGTIIKVFKNGCVKIRPESGAEAIRLTSNEYTVLQKAG